MLTQKQKQMFYREGYVKLSGAVPQLMVERARKAINHSIGEVGMHQEDLTKLRAQSYCNELRSAPVMVDLFNKTPLFQIAESLLGEGNALPCGGAQIALRFPGNPDADPGEPGGHLDGLGTGTNGIPKGEYRRGFTALVVIYLADVPEPYSGNFTVWPKSHLFFEEYFKREGHGVLAKGMPKVELPEGPVQMTGKAGDVVLAHNLLVHGAGPNGSANVRYAAIFRLRHVDCEQIGLDGYTDIWREWAGVREAVGE
ncbi:MAG: hypothetical protein HOC74_26215 [Gemmatimonadetes bacterium]|jgi:hypothetical protein|nr:hypothetical protein [Gemmatimonadota bacterium]